MTDRAETLGLVLVALGAALTMCTPWLDRWRRRVRDDRGQANQPTWFALSDDLKPEEDLDVRTWAVSRERDSYLDRRRRCILYAIAGAIVLAGSGFLLAGRQDSPGSSDAAFWNMMVIVSAVAGCAVITFSIVPYLSTRSAYRQRRLALASARVDRAITQACEGANPLKIEHLFELNRRQLDEYQLLTRKQQKSSFVSAQIASAVAFAVLVAGIVIALSGNSDIEKYLTSGLTALGSLLSGFLAATFYKSARDANTQMNRYYLEPQRTGRLLAAERIVSHIAPPPSESRAEMITAVLGWEMPGDRLKKKKKDGSAAEGATAAAESNGSRQPGG